jgi:hypothetical protein
MTDMNDAILVFQPHFMDPADHRKMIDLK